MAHVSADRVRDTSTSTGTGVFTVAGSSIAGFREFGSALAVNDTFYYAIQHQNADEWEVGLGIWGTGNQITRNSVYWSSNAGALVSFTAGTKDVFITLPAGRVVQLNGKSPARKRGSSGCCLL